MPRSETDMLVATAAFLGIKTGSVAVEAIYFALVITTEEERILLRNVLPILGWRRPKDDGFYTRGNPGPKIETPQSSFDLSVFGDLTGTVSNNDAWKATASTEPYTHNAAVLVARAMRAIGFERIRLRIDGKVSIVYVRGKTPRDRRRPIYVFRDLLTGTIEVTHSARSGLPPICIGWGTLKHKPPKVIPIRRIDSAVRYITRYGDPDDRAAMHIAIANRGRSALISIAEDIRERPKRNPRL